jgi:hypothetical protein
MVSERTRELNPFINRFQMFYNRHEHDGDDR